jgi:hypothetical protein
LNLGSSELEASYEWSGRLRTEGGTDPSGVKSQELGITHLAGSHQKLAVTSARHVAGNRNVIGRVGKD